MRKILVSFSGGMDSATLLGRAVANVGRANVLAISFSYGSKHGKWENLAAVEIANHYGVNHRIMQVSNIFELTLSNLLKTGGPIPEGHYEHESMKRTVVPGRNTIFISILASIAESLEFHEVWIGIHSGDHRIYPDCRPEYYKHMRQAVLASTENRVDLIAPFLWDNKTSIIDVGLTYVPQVPYHLTRTCYSDQELACGKCGACNERREAFAKNHMEDPIQYQKVEV